MNFQSSLFQEVSDDVIKQIFCESLGEEQIWETKLLEGGMFNTTYLVSYGSESQKAVLRLGPVNRQLLMGFEKNLMKAEVEVYSACKKTGIPCSEVLACDTSKQPVDRDFMIVAYIPSVVMAKAGLGEADKKYLYRQMGNYLHMLHQITGESFGFVSRLQEGRHFETWSDALIFEMEDITGRLEALQGLTAREVSVVREVFYSNRELLDEITVPHLLHTDLWEGNVLLDKESLQIAAIIDGDRAVFGDPDFEFASSWMGNPALIEGYGTGMKDRMNGKRGERRKLYQIFYFLLEAYVGSGEYNNPGQYKENKEHLWNTVKSVIYKE